MKVIAVVENIFTLPAVDPMTFIVREIVGKLVT